MNILIDTREQAPWAFSKGVTTTRKTLATGDYSLPGYEDVLCVERKSLPDLVKSVVTDWQRFSRDLRRMAAMDVAVIVVESSPTALFAHMYAGETSPLSVRGKLNRILIDFGIQTVFLDNREIAAGWVENLFQQFTERVR